MRHSAVTLLLVLTLTYMEICRGLKNETEIITKKRSTKVIEEIGRKLRNVWAWLKDQAKTEDTFVGRCAGAFKKMTMAMHFIIFKLGVIVTTLAFLSVLVLKSLGVGVVLLILSSLGLFAKFVSLKQQGGGHASPHGSAVHLHIHNKGGHSIQPYHSHIPDWYDRYDGNDIARTPAERSAIAELYRRVGLSSSLYDGMNSREDVVR